jgi:tRNA (mo5U34)-methyltransferase
VLRAKEFIDASGFTWHQRFRLDEDLYTPGVRDVELLLAKARIPEDLSDLTVLDVGTANGGVAFEAERRGAIRVVAVDVYPPDWFGFAQTRAFLGSEAEFVQTSIYGLPDVLGGEVFDLVFFWGVLYHLRHPLLALDELRRLTRGEASIETQVATAWFGGSSGWVRFHRHDELAGDSTNWFVPTVDALVAWCASSGFEPELVSVWPRWNPRRCIVKALTEEGDPEFVSLSYELPVRVRPRESASPVWTPRGRPRPR